MAGVLKLNAEQQRVREYLLGQLSAENRAQFEEQLLTDSELYEELVISEDELADDYLRNQLSPADTTSFESNFLAAPEHQEKLRFARALRTFVDARASGNRLSEPQAATTSQTAEPLPGRGTFLFFLPIRNRAFAYSLAVAMVLLIVGAGWLAWTRLINPTPRGAGTVLAVTLTAGLSRSEGEIKRITKSSDIDTIRLQLVLPDSQYQSYQAVVQDSEGEELATYGDLKAKVSPERSVVVDVDASELKPGDFQVKLSGLTPDGRVEGVASYSFRVVD